VDLSSQFFAVQPRERRQSSLFPVFDICTGSWDISGQIRKLSKIAPNSGRFCTPKIWGGGAPKVVHKWW